MAEKFKFCKSVKKQEKTANCAYPRPKRFSAQAIFANQLFDFSRRPLCFSMRSDTKSDTSVVYTHPSPMIDITHIEHHIFLLVLTTNPEV